MFGLMGAGSLPIGNTYPPGGESLADGILGLAPGCFNAGLNCSEKQDALSSLVRDGAISAHVFTMCLRDSDSGGGSFSLGPPGKQLPSSTIKVPLKVGKGVYSLPGSESVTVSIGGHAVMNYSETISWPRESVVDSGSGGLVIPQPPFDAIVSVIFNKISADSACYKIWSRLGLGSFFEFVGGFKVATKEMADCASPLIPDLSVRFDGDAELVVKGTSFFFPIKPGGSAGYGISWSTALSSWIFGTAFLVGKTVQFNAADPDNAYLAILPDLPEDDCTTDWSEASHFAEVSGDRGQMLSAAAGVVTVELSMGTPSQPGFVVQLDTGSQDLLLYSRECYLYGSKECQADGGGNADCTLCFHLATTDPSDARISSNPTGHFNHSDVFVRPGPILGEGGYNSSVCEPYIEDLIQSHFEGAELRRVQFGGGQQWGPLSLEGFLNVLPMHVQPYAKCGADREVCGNSHTFDVAESSTFLPKDFKATPASLAPPPFEAKIDCGAPPTPAAPTTLAPAPALPCTEAPAALCTGNPTETCFYDPTCSDVPPSLEGLGCNAGGVGQDCRFCGFRPYAACP